MSAMLPGMVSFDPISNTLRISILFIQSLIRSSTTLAVAVVFASRSLCSGATFTDQTNFAGIYYTQWEPPVFDDLQLYMTGGAAAADYDNDGWVDLIVTRLDATDILYRNLGDGTFVDVSSQAGLSKSMNTNGATWGDIDNDGDQDLYVTTIQDVSRRNFLYVNQGNGSFTEEALTRGADLSTQHLTNNFGSAFGDYDSDGYLDLFTVEWNSDSGMGNSRLLRNLGAANPGAFEDVTLAAGVDTSIGNPVGKSFAFAPTFADMDRDGHTDLVIAGDFGQSRLFWNNGDGTFTNGTELAGLGTDENGMGSAVGDYDGDGDLDWFVSSIYESGGACGGALFCGWGATGNRLYRNDGNRAFSDETDAAGVREGGWGWGSVFLDYDNDGDLDLSHTNGVDFPGEPRGAVFINELTRFWENEEGVFTEVATQVGVTDSASGKGMLAFDYDNDGDLDMFIVNNSGQPNLYRNDGGNDNDWLRVVAVGTQSNTDGVGAQVTVLPKESNPDEILYGEVLAGSHFLGQSEGVLHFGLADFIGTIDRITIQWPATGITQVFEDVTPNTLLTIIEPAAADWDHDGKIDAADYSLWQASHGMTTAAHADGDSNNDGDVDGSDFLTWQRQYSTDQKPANIAVPEPVSNAIISFGWSFLVLMSRNNRLLFMPAREKGSF